MSSKLHGSLIPTLTNLVSSYWPSGTPTRRLAPTIRSCRYFVNSVAVRAGAPMKFIENRKSGSANPLISRSCGWPKTRPSALSPAKGTIMSNLADLPKTFNTRSYAKNRSAIRCSHLPLAMMDRSARCRWRSLTQNNEVSADRESYYRRAVRDPEPTRCRTILR